MNQGGAAPFGPRQFLTKVERCAPVRAFASACLLQALRDIGFMGVALALLGVAVVVAGGSAAKAAPQLRTATAARAAVIFIQVSSSSGGEHSRQTTR